MKKQLILLVSVVLFWCFSSCRKNNSADCKYEQVNFYEQLNLNDIRYVNLKFDNNYIEYDNAGAKGVLIFRVSSTDYRTYERASPISPDDAKARLYVDPTGVLMRDSVNNQAWDLNGIPYIGSYTCQVMRYSTILDGSYLKISNY